MAKYELPAGTTSYLSDILILDSTKTDGSGLTGLVYNSAGLTWYYKRQGSATWTAVTLATMTQGTWASGGFVEGDATHAPGVYEIGIPDAAIAAGVKSVKMVLRGATNMADVRIEIELTAVSNQDAVRGGMTALPNANAEAAGGLYTRGSGAGQINQNANGQIDSNLVDWKGSAPASLSSTFVQVDAEQWKGGTIPAPNVTGVPKVDLVDWLGTAPLALSSQQVQAIVTAINGQAPPTNWSLMAIDGSGNVTVGTIVAAAIQSIWDRATSALTTVGSIGKYLVDQLANSNLASAIWNAVAASYNTAGTMGAKLNTAGGGSDPWATALPGSYTAGEAGYIVGNLGGVAAEVALVQGVQGSTVQALRGDTWSVSITGLGNISAYYSQLYFTIKNNTEDPDTQAALQISQSGGLIILNGAAYGTPSDGSLNVTDFTAGNITILVKPNATKQMNPAGYSYDLEVVNADGSVVTLTGPAIWRVVGDATRAVS